MENAAPAIAEPSLSKNPSPSFRLRNGSLNALRLRRVFDLFDRNGDGEITLDEMASALDALGLGADRSGLEATVGGYIPAGATGLRFDDFESPHYALGDALFGPILDEVPEEDDDEGDMKEAFRVFDEDGDGFISAAELQAVLKKLGLPEARSLATVQDMICNVYRNCDGRVDFGEFKNMMQGRLAAARLRCQPLILRGFMYVSGHRRMRFSTRSFFFLLIAQWILAVLGFAL